MCFPVSGPHSGTVPFLQKVRKDVSVASSFLFSTSVRACAVKEAGLNVADGVLVNNGSVGKSVIDRVDVPRLLIGNGNAGSVGSVHAARKIVKKTARTVSFFMVFLISI
jgi:hypothetical protein